MAKRPDADARGKLREQIDTEVQARLKMLPPEQRTEQTVRRIVRQVEQAMAGTKNRPKGR